MSEDDFHTNIKDAVDKASKNTPRITVIVASITALFAWTIGNVALMASALYAAILVLIIFVIGLLLEVIFPPKKEQTTEVRI